MLTRSPPIGCCCLSSSWRCRIQLMTFCSVRSKCIHCSAFVSRRPLKHTRNIYSLLSQRYLEYYTRSTATSYRHNVIWNITTTHTLNIYILLSQCYLEYYHFTHAQHLHLTVIMIFGILLLHTRSTSTSYCNNDIWNITTSHTLNIYILLS